MLIYHVSSPWNCHPRTHQLRSSKPENHSVKLELLGLRAKVSNSIGRRVIYTIIQWRPGPRITDLRFTLTFNAPIFHTAPLTHLPLHKLDALLADGIFTSIFLNEKDSVPMQISLEFICKSPIDNTPTLVQVMAWRWRGDKSLPEPMLT